MTTLTYAVAPELARVARKAAEQWNTTMKGLVELLPCKDAAPNVLITYGKVNRRGHPTRIAQCQRIGVDLWMISLADDETWAVSWWNRFFGKGHNALAALLHEFGHVFALPHAADPAYVMHPDIPDVNSISKRERELYRQKFETEINT